jgi:SAM-dependent methyltransferase
MKNRDSNQTGQAWRDLGSLEPYWAVLTQAKFRKGVLDEAARQEFFQSGESYIDWVFSTIRRQVDSRFHPKRALDFGCGVGRLALAMSARCDSVLGVDISEAMLREAKSVCDSRGVSNVTFIEDVASLSPSADKYDFINSSIVLQHIPCVSGIEIIQRLLSLLAEDGIAALHLTYSKGFYGNVDALPTTYIPAPNLPEGGWHHLKGLIVAAKRCVRRAVSRKSQPIPAVEANRGASGEHLPEMQMNPYILNPVLHLMQTAGVREFHAAFTDHTSSLGVVLFFRKSADGPYSHDSLFES